MIFPDFSFITKSSLKFKIPESPPWLLLRNREAHAEKSLRWLRGWVNEDAVRDEFSDFKRFQAIAQQCCECEKHKVTCIHPPPSISDQIRQLLQQRTFRPLVLMFILYFLAYFSSSSAIRPYYVQVFYYYESPIDPNLAVSYAGWVDVVSSITVSEYKCCGNNLVGKKQNKYHNHYNFFRL